MCGICGILSDSLCNQSNLRIMNDAISHRGPDDEGYLINDDFGIAMRRLSIIDVSTGHQPLSTPDSRYTIVFNGEIYNYKELKKNYLGGCKFRTSSDTEVLLYMYSKFGTTCLDYLDGMFAFCIYDSLKKEFFIARDRLGIKPLSYYHKDSNFLFSSEVKSFYGIKELNLEIGKKYLNDYFSFGFIPSPYSIFKNVMKLEPGHYMIVSKKKYKIEKYWDYTSGIEPNDSENYAEVKEKLKHIITSTVRKEMVSDVPVGSFLSGGLDSSIITNEMSQVSGNMVNTFTITFDNSRNDGDEKYSRYISNKLGTFHTETSINLFNTDINDIISRIDEPFAITSLIPYYQNSLVAVKKVKVALSGDGADEIFGGYDRYGKLSLLIALKNSKLLKNSFLNILSNLTSKNISYRKIRKGIEYFILRNLRLIEDGSAIEKYLSFINNTNLALKERIISRDVFSSFGPLVYVEKYETYFSGNSISKNDFLFFDAKTTLSDEMLKKADAASMLNSLEVRVPFLNRDIVDFAASLPFDYKFNGTGKRLLKDIYRDILGTKLVFAKKRGFNIPIAYWLRYNLKDEFFELINSNISNNLGLNNKFLHNEFNKFLLNKSILNEQTFYYTYFLLKWYKVFLNRNNGFGY